MSQFERLTIDDIARLAEVSRTTASMVLNGNAERYRISAATVERVLQVARDHHFTPSQSARALRSRRSNTLGLVIPDLTNSAHAALAQALESQCREQYRYQLVIVTSDEDPVRETEGIAHLVSHQVDGVVVVPCTADAPRYEQWVKRLPLVFADRRVETSTIPYVVTDAAETVATLVGEALAKGAREVVYFGGQPELSASRDRLAGYRHALATQGVAEQDDWVFQRDYQRESGYALMKAWFETHGRYPEALFAGSITLLEGVLEFINEAHRLAQAPGHLMTFDDHQLLDCLPLQIDAIVQDSGQLAEHSLRCVFSLLEGKAAPESLRVPAQIHYRQRRAANQ
ncbi:substrate-binding domain-containing protein [Paraburkholderia tropica]|uniref:LacI family transcriptional regulator n=1 Tax=Paraburkholderia tropica TaxID=92647 RepID=A0ABX5MWN6_9BURK|nr:LacI family DNA-binding transcriptional regulator [Paraburkholderia tropica]MDE1144519.1 LacI family DNA-binding transcriptional regulator [Paraburkholderia tropica]PXX17410.1 LacI family transcriptional regulator [Paraburkholderia tropica]PZW84592.1 LacI family transcriptional regulator [Paraburkholderia tropica]